jgi:hypothetical protein
MQPDAANSHDWNIDCPLDLPDSGDATGSSRIGF